MEIIISTLVFPMATANKVQFGGLTKNTSPNSSGHQKTKIRINGLKLKSQLGSSF